MHYDSPHHVSSRNQGYYGQQAWAHWEYSPEEWALFDRVDWQAVWLRYWLPILLPPVLLFLLGVVVFHLFVPAMVMIMIAFVLPPLAAIFVLRGYSYGEAKNRHKARKNSAQPQRVTFSQEGVWEAGAYFPLTDVFLSLQSVSMTSQPTVLHFRRKRLIRNNYRRDTLRVLVPHGHEEEAARLMQRFQAKIIAAQKPINTHPEPV